MAVLRERRGQSGWLGLARLTVASVEAEKHLLLTAVTGAGEVLESAWCDSLLPVPATVHGESTRSEPGALTHALAECEAPRGEAQRVDLIRLRWSLR